MTYTAEIIISKTYLDIAGLEQIDTVKPLAGNEQAFLHRVGPKMFEQIPHYFWSTFGIGSEFHKMLTPKHTKETRVRAAMKKRRVQLTEDLFLASSGKRFSANTPI